VSNDSSVSRVIIGIRIRRSRQQVPPKGGLQLAVSGGAYAAQLGSRSASFAEGRSGSCQRTRDWAVRDSSVGQTRPTAQGGFWQRRGDNDAPGDGVGQTMSEATRIIFRPGTCEGLPRRFGEGTPRQQPGIENVGYADPGRGRRCPPRSKRGHLDCVLLGRTRRSAGPAQRDRDDFRQHTRVRIVLIASGEASNLLE